MSFFAHNTLYGTTLYFTCLWLISIIPIYHSISESIAILQQKLLEGRFSVVISFDRDTLEKIIHEILREMSNLSNQWRYNNLLRVFTGVIIASGFFQNFVTKVYEADSQSNPVKFIQPLIMCIVYYGLIWFSVLVTGITNDYLFRYVPGCLAMMLTFNKQIEHDVDQMLIKFNALRNVRGLSFGGTYFTTQGVIAMGSFLLSLIVFLIRLDNMN